jgi:hypothetical protein
MPAWSLAKLMSTVTQSLGNRTDVSVSDASLWINQAEEEVWNQLPFDESEAIAISSTTVNEDKITLPSDFQETLSVSNLSASNAPMLLDAINVDQRDRYSTSSGEPEFYMLYDSWLELIPTPDSAYSIQLRYRKQRSDMTALTDVPSVSTRYRFAVMLKAKQLIAEHVIYDSETAALANNQYVSYMNSMPSDRALRNRENRHAGMSLPRRRGQKGTASSYSFDRSDH